MSVWMRGAMATSRPRVAIVHDWLVTIAGAEKVLAEMLKIWPHADLFAVIDFLDPEERKTLQGKYARCSFIQRLPGARRRYKAYLPLMPLAVEQLDLSRYDLIISSSHAVAKGVLTGPDQVHVSYVHSPIRYAWDLQHQYLKEARMERGFKSWLARFVLHRLRVWDHRTAAGVDHFAANSAFIGRRIEKAYRRESVVIYPPVDTEGFSLCSDKEDFYLTASRMVPYKMIPLIVKAFSAMPDKRLVVIGEGPEFNAVKSVAGGNVQLLGYQSFEVLRDHMQRARAFVFAAEEDFGIAPVEAQACGTPVIAYSHGGALETVRDIDMESPTGLFFHEQSVEAISAAIARFEQISSVITPENCRRNAERFSAARFRAEFQAYVESCMTGGEPRLSFLGGPRRLARGQRMVGQSAVR